MPSTFLTLKLNKSFLKVATRAVLLLMLSLCAYADSKTLHAERLFSKQANIEVAASADVRFGSEADISTSCVSHGGNRWAFDPKSS